MFGLLNPALTPIKAKAFAVLAGAVLVALLAAGGACWLLSNKVDGLQVKLGAVNANWASAVQTSNDNAAQWQIERDGLEARIKAKEAIALLEQQSAQHARDEQDRYDHALKIALNTLKETAHDDPEAAGWSVVRLPDSVVDGMCRAAASASGETEDCGGDQGNGGDAAGAPAHPVQEDPTT